VLRSYLPAIVFLVMGLSVGLIFAMLNSWVGRKRPNEVKVKADPYECGLPSDYKRGFRFGVSFYLVAMMFIIFDLEVILLFPVAVVLREFGMHAVGALSIFIGLLVVAFVYEWRRGALDWK
jgi:NADH-quinone oxidoreductase subunit A